MLFSIFISDLGPSLNSTGLGIDLFDTNISCLLFADDLVLVGKDEASLRSLISSTLLYFKNHHLEISEKKSKVMMYQPRTGNMTFLGPNDVTPILLEQVLSFKYLGVPLSCPAHGMFKSFNANCIKKAESYMRSILSLVKNGPDRSSLAHTLWTKMALPAILYGSEIFPLTQGTINVLERCQSSVGKFILQIRRNSTNVAANIDAGLQPVWSLVAERFIGYSIKTMNRAPSYWTKMALEEHILLDRKSEYLKHLCKLKNSCQISSSSLSRIKKQIKVLAIRGVESEREKYCISTFSMNLPNTFNQWFKLKPWVSDSALSKIFAEFRACNASLGNRGYNFDGRLSKICILCNNSGIIALNNECHMLFDCSAMEPYRQSCDIGVFISMYKDMYPLIASVKLMSLYLSDLPGSNITQRALSLYYMRKSWEALIMNI